MGGVNRKPVNDEVRKIINTWERKAIGSMHLDGPIDLVTKNSLMEAITDFVANLSEQLHPTPQAQEPERRKPGRPRNVN